MSDLVKIQQGMFINNDVDAYESYKKARKRAKREVDLTARVGKLEQEIQELKKIIQDLSR